MAGLTGVGSGAAPLSGSGKTALNAIPIDALSTSRLENFRFGMASAPLTAASRERALVMPATDVFAGLPLRRAADKQRQANRCCDHFPHVWSSISGMVSRAKLQGAMRTTRSGCDLGNTVHREEDGIFR
jgi:hypothetical protein